MKPEMLGLSHYAATLLMTGIIWMVQLAHYPAMIYSDRESFREYSEKNQEWTSWVVIGPMCTELVTAVALLFTMRQAAERTGIRLDAGSLLFRTSVIILLIIWLSTFLIQVPIHRQLLAGWNETLIQRLVATNWIRTIGWSLRSILLTTLLIRNS